MLQERLKKEPKETIYDFLKEVCKTKEEYTYIKNQVDNADKYLFWKTFVCPYFAKYVFLPTSEKDMFFGEKRNLSDEEIKNRKTLIKRIFRKKFLWIFEL